LFNLHLIVAEFADSNAQAVRIHCISVTS